MKKTTSHTLLDLIPADESASLPLPGVIQGHVAQNFDVKLTLLFKNGEQTAEYIIAHDDDHFIVYKFTRLGFKRASVVYHRSGDYADLESLVGLGYWMRALNYDVAATPAQIAHAELLNQADTELSNPDAPEFQQPQETEENEAEVLEILD